MGNAGEARLDVVALGRDEMSAAVNQVNAELDAMKAKLRQFEAANASSTATTKAAATSVGGLGGKLESLKESVKPIDKVRGTVENLRSNMLMVVGAATAIGGALIELVTYLENAGSAMQDLKDRAKEFGEGRDAMTAGIDMMREKLGIAKTKTEDLYNAAVVGASAARLEVDTLDRAFGEQQRKIGEAVNRLQDVQRAYGDTAVGMGMQLELNKEIDAAQREALKLLNDRAKKSAEIAEFERLSLEYIKGQNVEILKQATERVLPGASLFLSGKFGQLVDPAKAPGGGGGGGGGGGRGVDLLAEWRERQAKNLADAQRAAPRDAERDWRALQRNLDEWNKTVDGSTDASSQVSGASGGKRSGGFAAVKAEIAKHKQDVKDLVDSYTSLAAAIGGLAGPLAGLSSQLGTVAGVMSQSLGIAAQFAAGDLLGGITGVLGGVLSLFGETHRKARGIIAETDREIAATRSSGPSTVIINLAPGSDPQAAARATRQVLYSSRGTGADTRSMAL